MKRLLVFFIALSAGSFSAFGYSFMTDGIFYNITSTSNLTVEVTYGSSYGQYFDVVEIPQKTTYKGKYYTVTRIGKNAFSGCSGLTRVIIPQTVTSIESYAFSGCNAMLTVRIPEKVTSIGNHAFDGCSMLNTVEFDFTQTALNLGYGCSKGDYYGLFYDCPLKSVTLTRPLNVNTNDIHYRPFAYHPTLQRVVYQNWINTGAYFFFGCKKLTSVTLPSFATRIDDFSFAGCSSLPSFEMPETVTSIGKSAFRDCNMLSSFLIGTGVQTIGEYCFAECITLPSLVIPGSVTKIGNYAFNGCKDLRNLLFEYAPENLALGYGCSKGKAYGLFFDCPLQSVTLKRGLNYNQSSAYGYSPFANHPTLSSFSFQNLVNTGQYMLYGCGALASVTMSNAMVTINDYSFTNCNALKTVDLPESVTTLGKYAFYKCNSLKEVKGGKGLQAISDYCFSNCIGLGSFTFSGSVTSVGNYTFSSCTALKSLTFEAGNVPVSLGVGTSKGATYGLFTDCPLESVNLNRDLAYTSTSNSGWSPFYKIPTLKTVIVGTGATSLYNNLFADDNSLETVSLSETLTSIGVSSFGGCVSLKSLTLGRNVKTIGSYAFSGCKQLTGLIFPPSLKSIGNYAFRGCTSFNNLTIEEGEEALELGNGASEGEKAGLFKDCPLTSVFIGRNLNYQSGANYGYSPFAEITTLSDVRFGNPITVIPNFLFWCDTELSTVNFNKSCKVSSVGDCSFAGCSKLKDLELPSEVITIGFGPFQNTSIESFTIGPKVETIGDYAFNNCAQLTGLTIPPSVNSIGNYAFKGCKAFNSLIIEDGEGVLSLGYGATENDNGLFRDCPIEAMYIGRNLTYDFSKEKGYSPFAYIPTLKAARFGSSVTRIQSYMFTVDLGLENVYFDSPSQLNTVGKYAFTNCQNMATLDLPETITTLEEGTFFYCTSLDDFTLPENIKTIGNHAFANSTSLSAILIPASTTTIGNYAFQNCTGLKDVYAVATKPIAISGGDYNPFPVKTSTLHVAYGSVDLYKKATGWKEFYNIEALKEGDPGYVDGIEEIETMPTGEPDCYYTLDGKKIDGQPTKRGVYILNGRKVLINN